jgi:hypothetical protein
VASDRLLQLMNKGVSVEQVARVTKAFSRRRHPGACLPDVRLPDADVQDTVDALEYVRQLFAEGCIQSGFFHRFACTVHSPVGQDPQDFGVTLLPLPPGRFAKNDVGFIDPTGVDHDRLGLGAEEGSTTTCTASGWTPDVRALCLGSARANPGVRRVARVLRVRRAGPRPAAILSREDGPQTASWRR